MQDGVFLGSETTPQWTLCEQPPVLRTDKARRQEQESTHQMLSETEALMEISQGHGLYSQFCLWVLQINTKEKK